jgi:hypothetical protein
VITVTGSAVSPSMRLMFEPGHLDALDLLCLLRVRRGRGEREGRGRADRAQDGKADRLHFVLHGFLVG